MSYLPKIQEITEELIATLVDDNYFTDFEISSEDYARKRISDELTRKFLENGLDNEDEGYFTEEEFDTILKEIIAEDVLRSLQKNGLIDSYEDDETEEMFFLTDLGKNQVNEMENIEDIKGLNVFLDKEKEK
jgi:predicted transcriptional regulator